MKLWIDDQKVPPDPSWVWAKNYDEAMTALHVGGITHVSLDHDIGSELPEKTGYGIACWIEKGAAGGRVKRMTWDVHSENPSGRDKIMAAMQSAERFWK